MQRPLELQAQPALLRQIENRFGNAIRNVLHIDPAALTAEEATPIGFRTADEFGNRATAAQEERDRRLRAKGFLVG
jgi:hypothetical protein